MMLSVALLLLEPATVAVPEAARDCLHASADEIVVCRRVVNPDRFRLPALPPRQETGPPRAEWGLGGGVRAGVSASQVPMPQGAMSQRVMATVKIPF